MASYNRVILMGNLGSDPEESSLRNGDAVTNIRIATSSRWTDKATGEVKEDTQWHNAVLFRRPAEIAAKYLKKGDACLIEGRLKTRKWKDKNGVDHYTTEIVADRLELVRTDKEGTRGADTVEERSTETTGE